MKRRTVYLGAMPKRTAESIKVKIEEIVAAKLANQPLPNDVAAWIGALETRLIEKLAAVQLIEPRQRPQLLQLEQFFDDFIETQVTKPGTRNNYLQTKCYLLKKFEPNTPIDRITVADVDDWKRALLNRRKQMKDGSLKGLSENTVRSWCKCAKAVFNYACKKELIQKNPFAHVKTRTIAVRDRHRIISRETIDKVIAAAPDAEWKAIFALARYGGLRCPSEILALRWADVDFEGKRITVRSPKTSHHEGKEERTIPLFTELAPYLTDLRKAQSDSQFVVMRYRDPGSNIGTQAKRIVKRANVECWPKIFQNLRSSRQTELVDQGYAEHVVCTWLGNSEAVARDHYLQVAEEHFARASGLPIPAQVARKVAQQTAADEGNGQNPIPMVTLGTPLGSATYDRNAIICGFLQSDQLPLRGFEPRLTD